MRDALVRFGGLAAILGGAMWAAKGGLILAGHDQPPVVFEAAPLFFALGLLGLHALLRTRSGRLERIGAALAYLAAGFAAVTAVAALVAWDEDMPTPFNGTLAAATLCLLGALLALGIVARRTQILGRSSMLPLALGTLFVPLLLVGGLLSIADERLLEIPIVLLGLGWIVLGYAIASQAGSAAEFQLRASP